MIIQGQQIKYLDLKHRPELWPVVELEVERLQAVVDKLPKTADGAPVTPGATLYLISRGRDRALMKLNVREGSDYCWYSTEATAEAAAKESP